MLVCVFISKISEKKVPLSHIRFICSFFMNSVKVSAEMNGLL